MMIREAPVLEVQGIDAFYGSSKVLFGMCLQVREGEVVGLLGRNGMGKTTTVRAIMNLVSVGSGSIRFKGCQIRNAPPYRIARMGLGLVPEGRQIFPTLTVRENLLATAACRFNCRDPWDLDRVYGLFPILAERCNLMGNQLSGGEQQMLAIGRALMTNPQLLILDEATEGLAPLVRAEILNCLAHLKSCGQSILVIDKNVQALSRIADRHTIIEKGSVAWTGTPRELQENPALRYRYLGV
jgi:branched-chain amino acid transport system ATP-binding protein